ncbi:MAG: DegT/DnrJ/EryC1/StrS family aminotransferase [Imperialibacter sp.]|uniref:DegT/DnrJ/EryC1/StrS family aminotransferase n=1 Tax=Imperialibacter sp. TaxID=2038411 RepID=UPI0032EB23B7
MKTIEYEDLGRLNHPFFDEYKRTFSRVLDSGWFVLGNSVRDFEGAFAKYCSVSHSCGVANGLDALILALKCLDIEQDSEIIVPSNTYIATILAIVHAGHRPVLVEPDIETYNIDPDEIEERITPKTKAIMVVHLYGKVCAMDQIQEISSRHNLYIVEDCAQAHGARFKNRMAGSFGDFGAFSFYPTKNLGALGDAGCLVTNDQRLHIKAATMRNYGSKTKYLNEMVGYNSRLDEIQAAFLLIKLAHLDSINSHKRKLADLYFRNLKSDYILPQRHSDYYDVFHIFNVRHEKRDKLREFLLKKGIKTEIHYPIPPVKQIAMKGVLDGFQTPISEEIHQTTLSLPISFCHSEDDVLAVTDAMNKF